jgi:hypothetical protein
MALYRIAGIHFPLNNLPRVNRQAERVFKIPDENILQYYSEHRFGREAILTFNLDLIFANNVHRVVASGVFSLDLSDHSLIFCVIKAGVTKSGGNF